MDEIQENIYAKAIKFREDNTTKVDTWEEFKEKIEEGGFLLCHWDGTARNRAKIKKRRQSNHPLHSLDSFVCKEEENVSIQENPLLKRVLFARAY